MNTLLGLSALWAGSTCLAIIFLPIRLAATERYTAAELCQRWIGQYDVETTDRTLGLIYLVLSVTPDADGAVLATYTGKRRDFLGGRMLAGYGTGHVNAQGIMRFDYQDSFGNRGVSTLRFNDKRDAKMLSFFCDGTCRVTVKINHVADAHYLPFYGKHVLGSHRIDIE